MIQVIQLFPCKVISDSPPMKLRYDLEFGENHTGIQINLNIMKINAVKQADTKYLQSINSIVNL